MALDSPMVQVRPFKCTETLYSVMWVRNVRSPEVGDVLRKGELYALNDRGINYVISMGSRGVVPSGAGG